MNAKARAGKVHHSFVLAKFAANNIAAQPILYRRVSAAGNGG